MKILIVEDQKKTGDYLKQGLSEAGFVVDLARDGDDGLQLALDGAYDLLTLAVIPALYALVKQWLLARGLER